MQMVNNAIKKQLGGSSLIRKMFETGIELKKQFGAENVYDFSLGNPDLPPPEQVGASLQNIARNAAKPFSLGYMPNAGYPALREKLAAYLAAEQHTPELSAGDIIMTCGAAGGLNIILHTILEAGDEVIAPCPYFVEYDFYVANHGGRLVRAQSRDFTFELDVESIARCINERTRAVILNSPHNPTGQIYSGAEYRKLAEILRAAEEKYKRPIFVIADEPYRFLNFTGEEIPSVFEYFEHSMVGGSYSKSLSLAGERIGYVAVNPAMGGGAKELVNGLIFSNRVLGFVNAPAVAQQIISDCFDATVDLEIYRRRREAMADILTGAGIEFSMPKGAFYFFPRSPVTDEQRFVDAMLSERVLAVPGGAFGCPGYFRMAFCVDENNIRAAAEPLRRAVEKVK